MEFDFPELPPVAYDEVRRGVIQTIRRRKHFRRAVWTVTEVAACVMLAATGLFVLRQPAIPPAPVSLVRFPEVAAPAVAHSLPPRHRRARKQRVAPAQPLMVRLETDDPNVIILWTVN